MSTTSHTPLSLYRAFVRVHSKWPAQETRAIRLKDHILTRLRTEFRAPCESTQLPERIAVGERELVALRRMADGQVEKEDSPLRAFLPPRKVFGLLDSKTQEGLSEKNATNFDYFKAYLQGKFRRPE
ncbi:hypothetical protein HK097_007839 [Rhizophlyctis rosea]|uniref:Uncharacterized protein n=1 Tax=Rhizophlyctis rosea TaxID=64517 RepID=A0AAD5SIZ3_9FUNG|nr:hypothetical protein HK097_007839 [Rhizophlyctis rosea]